MVPLPASELPFVKTHAGCTFFLMTDFFQPLFQLISCGVCSLQALPRSISRKQRPSQHRSRQPCSALRSIPCSLPKISPGLQKKTEKPENTLKKYNPLEAALCPQQPRTSWSLWLIPCRENKILRSIKSITFP